MPQRSRRTAITCGVLGLGLFVLAILVGRAAEPPTTFHLALAALLSSTSFVLFALGGALAGQEPIRVALGLGPARIGPAGIALLVLGTIGISHVIDAFFYSSGLRSGSALEVLDQTLAQEKRVPIALTLLGVGIAPGFGEELLFRGLVMRLLITRAGATLGIALSAAFFGAAHLDPVQASGAFLLGLYLGAAALASGSTWIVVVCHIANNLAALSGPLLGFFTASSGPLIGVLSLFFGVASLVLLVRTLRERHRTRPA